MGGTYNKVPPINMQRASGFHGTNNISLIEQRRAAGQCFKCGDKYHPGHVCVNKSLNTLQGLEDILKIYDEECLQEEPTEVTEGVLEEDSSNLEVGVSVHVLSGEK